MNQLKNNMKKSSIDILAYDYEDMQDALFDLIKRTNGKKKYIKDISYKFTNLDIFVYAISNDKFTMKEVMKELKSGNYPFYSVDENDYNNITE